MGVHRFAVATALATFCLLIAGGLVSTTESGLACPDWPLCEGKYIPKMIDGKQYEHTHRLVASFVGAMTFGLCAVLLKYRRRSDRLLAVLGGVAAVLVTIQALLGALTVKLKLPTWVSTTHQATAMAFFSLVVSLAFLTRQRMDGPRSASGSPADSARETALARRILPVVALCYAQIVVGALMRHTVSGLACGFDFPLCNGALWPVENAHLGTHIHMVHRALGVLTGLAVLDLAAKSWRDAGGNRALRGLSVAAALAVVTQVTLGIATVLASRELVTMTVHSSLGAALLAGLWAMYWVARPSRIGRPLLPRGEAPSPVAEKPSLEPA